MRPSDDLTAEFDSTADEAPAERTVTPGEQPWRPTRVPKLGVWAWCFVGLVAAAIVVALALAALSEILLPLTFAAVLAVVFKPLFVEPRVMGGSLDVHPVVVLVVIVFGGIVGLILAVPSYVVARDAVRRFASRGLVERAVDRAKPTVQRLLE